MQKLTVAILYGGKSTEHEVSLVSAKNIINHLDATKFNLVLIAISPQGQWYWQNMTKHTSLPTEFSADNLIQMTMSQDKQPFATPQGLLPAIDVVFPVLHGQNGEDGTVQGLLRCLNLPFVGCDVLSTALCMDKIAMKQCLQSAGIKVAPWKTIHAADLSNLHPEQLVDNIGFPIFVKPANAGSSVGIVKVNEIKDLMPAIINASKFDQKILIEAMIKGREIECAVLGNLTPQVSQPGEIITHPNHDFYSYDAKYIDMHGATLSYPANLTQTQVNKIQTIAIQAYQALHCEGMARVDCFLTADDTVYINELNTIPGFTPISMYPKLWEISGLTPKELVTKLIHLALEKFAQRQSLQMAKQGC